MQKWLLYSSSSPLCCFKDPSTKVKEFTESKPLLSDFDAQIKYYQRLETQIEELPSSYHIGPVEYLTERIKEALVTETKAWKQAFGKALAEKVTIICMSVVVLQDIIALLLYLSPLYQGRSVRF